MKPTCLMCYKNINFSYAEGNKVFIHSLSAADLSFLRPKLINHNEVINKSFTSFISFLESTTLPAHQKGVRECISVDGAVRTIIFSSTR